MEENKTSINWFPGHMKKTLNMFENELKQVDLVIEILDARIPLSSKNPEVERLVKNKKRIILLNKLDLVDKASVSVWQDYFVSNDLADYVIPMSVEKGFNISSLRNIIDKLYNEKLEKMKKKGLIKTEIRALVCGIPNVGKSKFINKIASKSKAGVGNLPGFTRGKQWITVNKNFYLLDTPGVLWPKFENNEVATNLAITGSIKDDILRLEDIAIYLLNKMKEYDLLDNIFNYYNIEKKEYDSFYELLKDIEKRLLIHTKEYDYDKISKKILKDYREGKLGKFFLEMPK
ncbi:ribosome biogenesis GTPase YlqF [Oceanivirga miroungae]|uniref:Ribosome biogenesis GTPase A n=1 Tax=Oceanivirga miroungae TaxID=1130046 RepID=A0A6I8MAV3_9FUSO|nr:ribosome biogenesis GTPase YlqF [Oceanivirga miroungae]VWL85388.1 HSR1-like GTP-binding protein [Oceanivirga miroungae]